MQEQHTIHLLDKTVTAREKKTVSQKPKISKIRRTISYMQYVCTYKKQDKKAGKIKGVIREGKRRDTES